MKNNLNATTLRLADCLPEGKIRKALVLGDSPERIEDVLKRNHFHKEECDGFTNPNEAFKAFETGIYDTIVVDSAMMDQRTIELIRLILINKSANISIITSCEFLPCVAASIWKQELTGFFYHVRNEQDNFAGPINYLLTAPADLKCISITKSEINGALKKMAGKTGNVVLIKGAKGSGKYPIAQYIHSQSELRLKPFMFVHCSNIQHLDINWSKENKKAFSNNIRHIFKAASDGTVYFHNIERLTYEAQTIMADVLKQILKHKAYNSRDKFEFKGNIVFATSADLEKEVADRHFNHDLYDIIKHLKIVVPPLHEYKDEILPLVKEFVLYHCQCVRRKSLEFSDKAIEKIINADWRDNVRLIDAVIRYCVAHTEGTVIEEQDIHIHRPSRAIDADNDLRKAINTALRTNKGNKSAAARELDMERSKLDREIKRLQITNPYKRRSGKVVSHAD